MELDQAVVRGTFRHYGVQPFFDDERVQWWFGDASKSLAALPPKDYFASFDLVLIDLYSYTFDNLKVKGEPLVDYMMKFVQPGGVIVRQEDFLKRTHTDFAQYTVDFDLLDTHYFCLQSFTMGSKTIDFYAKQASLPLSLNVETVYYDPVRRPDHNHTALWAGFRKNRVSPPSSPTTPASSNGKAKHHRLSVAVILEAEQILLSPLEDRNVVKSTLTQALVKARMTGISVLESSPSGATEPAEWYSHILFFQEGYVIARTWPRYQYMAVDLLLWNRIIETRDHLWTELLLALGGGLGGGAPLDTKSSYRITMGGMFGLMDETDKDQMDNDSDNSSSNNNTSWAPSVNVEEDSSVSSSPPLETRDFNVILQQLLSLAESGGDDESEPPVVAVACADRASSCQTLANLEEEHAAVVPIRWCPPLVSDQYRDAVTDSEQQHHALIRRMIDCERQTRNSLREVKRKIQGIVMDPDAPIEMGQILHKIFNNTVLRYDLLAEDFVILAPTTTNAPSSDWKESLLERFRTEIVEFNPVFQVNVAFRCNKSNHMLLKMGILSAGRQDFYANLSDRLRRIQGTTELKSEVQDTRVGLIRHVPDYQPSATFSNDDYDLEPSREQYLSQRPVGYQAILQFEVQPIAPISKGANVIINEVFQSNWFGTWSIGQVLEANKEDRTFHVEITKTEEHKTVERKALREINHYSAVSPLEFGEFVLLKSEDGEWRQGSVAEVYTDGTYRLRAFDGDDLVLKRHDLVRLAEKPPALDKSPVVLSMDVVKKLFEGALQRLDTSKSSGHVGRSHWRNVGDGCIFTVFFNGGVMVASWDGMVHIDANIFFEGGSTREAKLLKAFEEFIVESIPDMTRVQYDEQPRGFGRVVNTQDDLNKSIWFDNVKDQKYPFGNSTLLANVDGGTGDGFSSQV